VLAGVELGQTGEFSVIDAAVQLLVQGAEVLEVAPQQPRATLRVHLHAEGQVTCFAVLLHPQLLQLLRVKLDLKINLNFFLPNEIYFNKELNY
jgi:hypothetical protein